MMPSTIFPALFEKRKEKSSAEAGLGSRTEAVASPRIAAELAERNRM
jgi:hypothetical protein